MASTGQFVSRAGEKLQGALVAFDIDVRGLTCADFGCNVGGFTDCLLRAGAVKVYAIDTGYGELAWKLRKDPRVVVMERTNALYCDVPEPVDIVTIDVAWTPQAMIVPAATRWLKKTHVGEAAPKIISLLKPHYELAKMQRFTKSSVLTAQQTCDVCLEVAGRLGDLGWTVKAMTRSVLLGKGGNSEFLLWLELMPVGA